MALTCAWKIFNLDRMHEPASFKSFLERQLPQALDLLRQMVGINSYTANPAGVNLLSRFTAECFEPMEFVPEFVKSTNPRFGEHLVMTRPGRSADGR